MCGSSAFKTIANLHAWLKIWINGNPNRQADRWVYSAWPVNYSLLETEQRDSKISLETKTILLNCYIISIILYGSECLKMRKKLEATEIKFYRGMLRMTSTEHVFNKKIFKKMWIKRRYTSNQKKIVEISGTNKERELVKII